LNPGLQFRRSPVSICALRQQPKAFLHVAQGHVCPKDSAVRHPVDFRRTERSEVNPDVSGLFVGQIPVWPPDRLRLRLRMTRDEGLFGRALR